MVGVSPFLPVISSLLLLSCFGFFFLGLLVSAFPHIKPFSLVDVVKLFSLAFQLHDKEAVLPFRNLVVLML